MTADAMGGVWPYALELAAGFAGRGIEILLAVMGDAPTAAQRAAAAAVPGLRLEMGPFRLEWMAGADAEICSSGRWLRSLGEVFAPDIVHLNGYAHAELDWRAPVVVAAHSCVRTWWRAVLGYDPPADWDQYTERVGRGLAAADLVVAPTEAFLQAMQEAYGEFGATRVIRNGSTPGALLPRPKEPIVLAAGRLWDEAKNIRVLDLAAADVAWPVHVAGSMDRPDGGSSTRYANVHGLGPLAPDELRHRLDRAAIVAAPALYEPFGLAVLEAAQSGCALVLGDIATFRELWQGAAVFVSPRDHKAWAEALTELSADPDTLVEFGRRARHRARAYDAERMVRQTLAAYGEAAAFSPCNPFAHRHPRVQAPSPLVGVGS